MSHLAVGQTVWFDYLDAWACAPVAHDFTSLPPSSTLVIAGPFENAPGPHDARRCGLGARGRSRGGRRHVGGGLFRTLASVTPRTSRGGHDLARACRCPARTPRPSPRSTLVPAASSPGDAVWATVYGDEPARCSVVRTVGRGEVVWLADSAAVSNDGIGDATTRRSPCTSRPPPAGPSTSTSTTTASPRSRVWGTLGSAVRRRSCCWWRAWRCSCSRAGGASARSIAELATPEARGGAYIGQLARIYRLAGARAEALSSSRTVSRALSCVATAPVRAGGAPTAGGRSNRGVRGAQVARQHRQGRVPQAAARLAPGPQRSGGLMGDPTAIRTARSERARPRWARRWSARMRRSSRCSSA